MISSRIVAHPMLGNRMAESVERRDISGSWGEAFGQESGRSPGSATQEQGMAIHGAHLGNGSDDRVCRAITVLLSYALFRAP
jgi:hypothetical protein